MCLWVDVCFFKEAGKGDIFFDELLYVLFIKARKPFDDLVELLLGSSIFFQPVEVEGIDRSKNHFTDFFVFF
jgi:hypothetical protein